MYSVVARNKKNQKERQKTKQSAKTRRDDENITLHAQHPTTRSIGLLHMGERSVEGRMLRRSYLVETGQRTLSAFFSGLQRLSTCRARPSIPRGSQSR